MNLKFKKDDKEYKIAYHSPCSMQHGKKVHSQPINLIKHSGIDTISSFIKPNIFADTFKGLTFYIESKNDNRIKNIFIRDDGNNLNNLLPENSDSKDQTILAESGFIQDNKIILENGLIQSYDQNNTIRVIQFNKTLLNFDNFDNRVIKDIKIQETPTTKILVCLKKYYSNELNDNIYIKNCPKNNIAVIIETFSRRLGMPFYIPIISLLISFLLIYRYSGFSNFHFITYLSIPFLISPALYLILINKLKGELK